MVDLDGPRAGVLSGGVIGLVLALLLYRRVRQVRSVLLVLVFIGLVVSLLGLVNELARGNVGNAANALRDVALDGLLAGALCYTISEEGNGLGLNDRWRPWLGSPLMPAVVVVAAVIDLVVA
jgi:hypothetical protein